MKGPVCFFDSRLQREARASKRKFSPMKISDCVTESIALFCSSTMSSYTSRLLLRNNSSYGVTVSTLDFESSDGGSNPPWTLRYFDPECPILPASFGWRFPHVKIRNLTSHLFSRKRRPNQRLITVQKSIAHRSCRSAK